MAKLHDGLTFGALAMPGAKWRVVLKFDVLEYAVDLLHWEKFPARVAEWWEATNGRGVLVISPPEVKPDGRVAVVDVQILQASPVPSVGEVVGMLDELVPGVDVVAVFVRPSGTSEELAAGRAALLAQYSVTLAGKVGAAVSAVARPVVDMAVLAGGLLLFYLILSARRKV